MKKIIFITISILCGMLSAQNNIPNPYSSIGKPAPKVATLSNGQYDEFLLKEPLVLINGDAINRKTNELVYTKENNPKQIDSLQKREEDRFRFLSIDPLTKEYPWYSPYQFAGNDVIANIDLDGAEPKSVIMNSDGFTPKLFNLASSTILYQPSKNAIIEGGAVPMKVEYEQSITGAMVRDRNARAQAYINQAKVNQMNGGQAGNITPIYPEAIFLGGPAIETGSIILDLAYEVTIGSVGKPIGQLDNILYRGVNEGHIGYNAALKGEANSIGGSASALEHNMGNTNSEFTSWTSDYEVAKNYALRPEGTGVILKKNFSNQQITKSPDLKSIILKQGGGTVKENEKLIKGNVSGAEVIKNP